jgi:ABC-type sugar transport system ATPase subunit
MSGENTEAGARSTLIARPPAVEFRRLTKAFSGQLAVNDVSFGVNAGEVHALVGENGAGKTTLIKVLAGEHTPDAGEILLEGQPLAIHHPWQATEFGMGFIHQEPALVPSLSIAENVTLGLGLAHQWGLVDWRRQRQLVAQALGQVGLDVDPRRRLADLGIAERQLVAVARVMLLTRPRVIVFDEVTAPLTDREIDHLFTIVRSLRQQDVAVIYISHRLEEIFVIADRVTVMRNGSRVTTEPVSGLDQRGLVRLIIGHDRPGRLQSAHQSRNPDRAPLMSARNLTDDLLRGVSLDLYDGEILGLAGLVGAGRTNILKVLAGVRAPWAGEVEFMGQRVQLRHPADAIARGIAMVTEDRKHDGIVPGFPLWQQITLPSLKDFGRMGVLSLRPERRAARAAVKQFDIRARSIHSAMRDLSGGNQQKAILAQWLSRPLRVLLLDEPTHGVDIGAKEDIYEIIRSVAARGVGVIVVSSELEELEVLCSRVLMVSRGEIVGELSGSGIKKPQILATLFAHGSPPEGAA